MAVNRATIVDRNFVDAVRALPAAAPRADLDAPVRRGSRLVARLALSIFESMVASRHLDFAARDLKARGEGFYTIGSAGHEGTAAVAAACRPSDMAFLHYRSGGFYVQRARQVPGQTPLLDVLLGIVASSDEPIAGGRHKVFGSVELHLPPQTSTIASHLPKAMGAAFAVGRRQRLGLGGVGADRIVICSFGDASANHSTACGAFNAAAIASHQNLPCPALFVCEDNGIGISVRTPRGWLGERFRAQPGISYFSADGLDVARTYDAALTAVEQVRPSRRPAFLHLSLVRLLGHAGSDVEQLYRDLDEIEESKARDPLVATARLLVGEGWLQPQEALDVYEETRARVATLAHEVARRPRLTRAAEVTAPLAPCHPDRVAAAATARPPADARLAFWGTLPEAGDRPRHLAWLLNRALGDLLVQWPELIIFGEDVARKGGVYHVTADLEKRAGLGRVFNTPLDETANLGLAIGAGHEGLLPMPEIQYLAYLHNAIDQLRGEACSLQFFSQARFANPMVVRIAGLAYQRGFGGHFHNDNSVAALRDIPGLLLAVPSNGEDAVGMLRTCVAAARADGRVAVFLEPIARYMTRDLYEDGDGRWSFPYPPPGVAVPLDSARTWGDGQDLTIVTYGNGVWLSLRAARHLEERHGVRSRVLDLRWLNPLPLADLVREARATGQVLVVDECRRTGGVAEGVLSALVDCCQDHLSLARVAGHDTYIPLGDAANLVLVQEGDVVDAALALLARRAGRAS